MKKRFLIVSLVCAIAAIAAFQSVGAGSINSRAPKMDAAATYQSQCAKCHREDGKGIESLPDIPNFTDAAWQSKHTDKELSDAISGGKGIMPPYKDKLSAAEITGLVKYIRTLGGASKSKKKG
jgi:mono/diheme cytochrome c family protein